MAISINRNAPHPAAVRAYEQAIGRCVDAHALTGDALAGETERLHLRVAQLFDRFETQLRQVIREAEVREGLRPTIPLPAAANLLMAAAEGRISQYVRSGFRRPPTADWSQQWEILVQGFFREAVTQPLGTARVGQAEREPMAAMSPGRGDS